MWGHLPTLGCFQPETAVSLGCALVGHQQWEMDKPSTASPLVFVPYPCFHAPVKSVTKERRARTASSGPRLQFPPLLPWSSGGQHMGTSRGPLTMDSCSIPRQLASRMLRLSRKSPRVRLPKGHGFSHIFCSGYYYFMRDSVCSSKCNPYMIQVDFITNHNDNNNNNKPPFSTFKITSLTCSIWIEAIFPYITLLGIVPMLFRDDQKIDNYLKSFTTSAN